jgi:hypothetical protein
MNIKHCLFSLALAVVCGMSGGCGSGDTNDTTTKSPEMTAKITQQQAEAIAKGEAAKRGWKDLTIQHVRQEGDIWVISLERIPAMPGGHAVVKVSNEGKVVGFMPGA